MPVEVPRVIFQEPERVAPTNGTLKSLELIVPREVFSCILINLAAHGEINTHKLSQVEKPRKTDKLTDSLLSD